MSLAVLEPVLEPVLEQFETFQEESVSSQQLVC
jgi:hypothetical protein